VDTKNLVNNHRAIYNGNYQRTKKTVAQQNAYLAEHPHAKPTTALKNAYKKATTLQIQSWVEIKVNQNTLSLEVNQDKLKETARLDGCYVIKSDLPPQIASTQTLHDRYKGLAEVEFAFRTIRWKLSLLEQA
jgi:hypothetical protein